MPDPENPPRKPSMARSLANYRLQYVNDDFPILSLIYAVMAGGEHTLYCDYTEDFVKAYQGRAQHLDHMKKFNSRMSLFVETSGGIKPEDRKQIVHANRDDWKVILECLLEELDGKKVPEPKW